MLRKFKIAIDGQEYLVEMEEIGGAPAAPTPVATTPAAAPVQPTVAPTVAPTVEDAPAQPATSAVAAGADALTAPMPGTILRILVNVGDAVKQNQPVMILEAMKMENEIVAAADGVVSGIHVAQGDMVNPGDALITIA